MMSFKKIGVNILITVIVLVQLFFTTVPFHSDMGLILALKNIFMWLIPSIALYILWQRNISEDEPPVKCPDNNTKTK